MYSLKKLPYAYDSLEPYIDAPTMELHYSKHHQGYLDKLNAVLADYPELQKKSPEDLIMNLDLVPRGIRLAVRNQGGGVVNHNFFWTVLQKNNGHVNPEIAVKLQENFGGFEKFKKQFMTAAVGLFGSGWTWLVKNNNEKLEIISTSNQDSPLSLGKIPLLAIDVWEHAYYLKYQNRRAEYIEAFFNVINWEQVHKIL